jgi:hypothetical protein
MGLWGWAEGRSSDQASKRLAPAKPARAAEARSLSSPPVLWRPGSVAQATTGAGHTSGAEAYGTSTASAPHRRATRGRPTCSKTRRPHGLPPPGPGHTRPSPPCASGGRPGQARWSCSGPRSAARRARRSRCAHACVCQGRTAGHQPLRRIRGEAFVNSFTKCQAFPRRSQCRTGQASGSIPESSDIAHQGAGAVTMRV